MSIEIKMPELSPTMTKGLLANWLVSIGSEVKAGDVIAEVETDKVTVEIEAEADGVVKQINTEQGTEAEVDAVIMIMDAPGAIIAKPVATPANEQAQEPVKTAQASAPQSNMQEEKSPEIVVAQATSPSTEQSFSPLAKRMAMQQNIDTSKLQGTGAKGKIVKRDIEKLLGKTVEQAAVQQHANSQGAATALTPNPTIDLSSVPAHKIVNNSAMRNVVAERLTASSRDIPHFHMTVDCHIDALLALRKQLNERKDADYKVSVNDFVIKSVATAMKKVPQANCMWAGDHVMHFEQVDISMAVAVKDGLITPVIKNVGSLGLADIANTSKSLAAKAREGKLQPHEYQGGTFTISNLGMYGIQSFTSIINPPQNGILSVGVGEQRPVVIDSQLSVATVMSVTLAMDHRCVDGATGAEFMQAFKQIIEDPLSLLL